MEKSQQPWPRLLVTCLIFFTIFVLSTPLSFWVIWKIANYRKTSRICKHISRLRRYIILRFDLSRVNTTPIGVSVVGARMIPTEYFSPSSLSAFSNEFGVWNSKILPGMQVLFKSGPVESTCQSVLDSLQNALLQHHKKENNIPTTIMIFDFI